MPGKRLAYGVDIGGTTVKAGLVDETWRLLWRSNIPTETARGPKGILDEVVGLATGAAGELGVSPTDVEGIGVGLPGLVDSENGTAGPATHLPGWDGFPVAVYLKDGLGINSRIDHDLRLITTGEMLCGAAKGLRNFVLATVGTGIGICIVIDGHIYRRSTGDMGHMTIDRHWPDCPCGGIGCLEGYISVAALAEEAKKAQKAGKANKVLSPEELAASAQAGERWAKEIFDRAGTYLGFGMLNVVALLNPEVFIVGGGLMEAGELLLAPAIDVLERHAAGFFHNARERVRIAQLGDDAGVIGAASLILRPQE